MRVLVADDDTEVRSVLVDFLNLHGFETLEATNGLEALLQVKHGAPDAILLDVRMPRLGGLDALKRIRAFNGAIVIVVITGAADETIREQALAGGARVVLDKPVVFSDLLRALGDAGAGHAVAPASTAPAAPVPEPSPGARVLVVDDDALVRDTIVDFLTMRGYRASIAPDGPSAIRALTGSVPDVILLDIDMPGLSGTDALPTIRALAPQTSVIMVSGSRDAETARRALTRGAFDYVVKPIDFAYLTKSLETALAMRSLEAGP